MHGQFKSFSPGKKHRRAPISQRYWRMLAEKMIHNGKTIWEVMNKLPKLNSRSVRILKRKFFQVRKGASPYSPARARAMKLFLAAGYSYEEVGKIYNLSRQEVHQEVKRGSV